ncbi:hypothetical protein UY3_05438 [Chelonia mydas]|uniref:Myb/SANT-like DNA-binding domain-containing protein n=1 Tax=Chelonia mydas TaxID=8469 RepID=M7BNW2_CHEMY|nr:hypothetical protein UY3_05438 [Chelonia mydas]
MHQAIPRLEQCQAAGPHQHLGRGGCPDPAALQPYDTYRQISQCMTERGHDRDTLQCRVKVKELQNACHKAREANHHSSAAPTNCRFYKDLDAIPCGDSTSTAKATVDTSVACVPVESGLSQEEEILDEDVEGEGDLEAEDDSRSEMHAARSSSLPRRRLASNSCRILMKCKQERRPLSLDFDYTLTKKFGP